MVALLSAVLFLAWSLAAIGVGYALANPPAWLAMREGEGLPEEEREVPQ